MTLTLTGVGFDNTTTASLVSASNTVFPANSVGIDLPTQITATFNAAAVPAGTYSVRLSKSDGGTATLADAFTVKQGGKANLEANLVVPSKMGYHLPGVIDINYRNTGDVAMPAPVIVLRPTQTHADGTTTSKALLTLDSTLVTSGFWTSAIPAGFSNVVEILASGGTPGVLQPGESETIPVYYGGWQQPWDMAYPPFSYQLITITADDTTPLNLTGSLPALNVDANALTALYGRVNSQIGSTLGGFVTRMDDEASYLGRLGQTVTDVGKLLAFEFEQADALSPSPVLSQVIDIQSPVPGLPLAVGRSFPSSLTGRYLLGPFGRGWTWDDNVQSTLVVQTDGTVVITGSDGSTRQFQPDSRGNGAYFDQTGDYATLASLGGGVFQLTAANGEVTRFQNGQVVSIQSPSGDKITVGYTAGRVSSLSQSPQQSLTIAYNSFGRIQSVTNSLGQATHYAYDATGQYLLTVTDFNGLATTYTYNQGSNPALTNALLSVTTYDSTKEVFDYDTNGRLISTSLLGGPQVQYTYGIGSVTASDSANRSLTEYFDPQGQLVKLADANHATHFQYDVNGNLVGVTDPMGQTSSFAYNSSGNLVRSLDPLGNTTTYTYGKFNVVTSITDPKGNVTQYQYDPRGNLLTMTDASGTAVNLVADTAGQTVQSTSANGNITQYTYNPAGQLLSKTYADNTQVLYTYDTQGNLVTATDASGTTTLTYDPSNHLHQISYPGGNFFTYTYDSAYRRIQMTDQTGFTIHYTYNALGQLSGLLGSTNQPLVTYTYNKNGQLQNVQNANGTSTTYQYDAGGNVLSVANLASSGTTTFAYTYDSLGRRTTMSTSDGKWTYTYDAVGNLTHAVFASNNPGQLPNQDLKYAYDAAGNRTQSVVNGAATSYTTNNLNQYTVVGAGNLRYDAAGNLLSQTDASGTTNYTYDRQDHLTGVSGPAGNWTFRYDVFGNRSSETHNGQIVNYAIDPGTGEAVGEYDATGTLLAHNIYGLGLTSRIDAAAGTQFFSFDASANTTAVTGANGTVLNQYRYLPFGQLLAKSENVGNPFQFGGQAGLATEANGLTFMHARFENNAWGRFISQDPLNVAAGLNLYTYANNDPVNQFDPSGLFVSPYGTGGVSMLPFDPASLATKIGAAGSWIWSKVDAALANPNDPLLDRTRGGISLATLVGIATSIERSVVDGSGTLSFGQTGLILSIVGALVERSSNAAKDDGAQRRAAAVSTGLTVTSFGLSIAGAAATTEGTSTVTWAVLGKLPVIRQLVGSAVAGWSVGSYINSKLLSEQTKDVIGDTLFESWLSVVRLGQYLTGNKPTYSQTVGSLDPNDLLGPAGFGPTGFIDGNQVFPYRIDFENDPTATAPAQRVTVSNQLDANLDWNTFQLSEIGFGDTLLIIPPGSQHYQTTVQMTQNGKTFNVQVEAGLLSQSGQLVATFQSLDPQTQLPPDVLTGFLPPEDTTGRGMGHVSYTIQPKANLSTGTQIRNVALITFDFNPSIATDQKDPHDASQGVDLTKQALNTIDAGLPTSQVNALPVKSGPAIIVQWSGSDDVGGSGMGTYDLSVATDGGPFQPWQTGTTSTSATYTGQVGHSYAFSSLATDNVGHRQVSPSAPATTQVVANSWHNFANPYDVDANNHVEPADVLALIIYINAHSGNAALPAGSGPPYYDVAGGVGDTGDLQITPVDVLTVIAYINGHPPGSSEGEASQPPAGSQAGLVPTAPDSGGDLIRATPVLLVTAQAVPTPLLAMDGVVPWSGPTDGPLVPAITESRDASGANSSRGLFPPPFEDERDRPGFRPLVGVSGGALRRMVADSRVSAADHLFASFEDLLPDLAADVDRAWRG